MVVHIPNVAHLQNVGLGIHLHYRKLSTMVGGILCTYTRENTHT